MKREIDIYDSIEDIEASRKRLNPKTKKVLTYLLCALVGVLVAVGLILLANFIFTGASSPEEAIAEYERAAILYDIDGMIEYSSPYNKIVLYGNRETSDRLLESYLKKGYEGKAPQYSENDIKFGLISVLEYEKGSLKYEEAMIRYTQKVKDGDNDIDKIAIVKMKVTKGDNETTRQYLSVKIGSRWYFAYAGA